MLYKTPRFRLLFPLVTCFALSITVGCTPSGSFKISTVPSDRSYEEKIIRHAGAWESDRIALIDISGVLMNSRANGLFSEGEHPVASTVEKLKKAAKDDRVKAVVLRINSPGGSVTASDTLYYEIAKFRKETKKPVIAFFQDVAASGAYFLACATDEIIAQRSTVTGSIGVIMQMVDLSGTLHRIGVRTDAITSGAHKDAGSPFREMRPEERAVFQAMVNDFYQQFVNAVDAGRPKLSRSDVLTLADGRVYTAQQALDAGLVDRIAMLDDAVRIARERAGIEKAHLVRYNRPMDWAPNIYAQSPNLDANSQGTTVNLLNINMISRWTSHPQFMYIWTGF